MAVAKAGHLESPGPKKAKVQTPRGSKPQGEGKRSRAQVVESNEANKSPQKSQPKAKPKANLNLHLRNPVWFVWNPRVGMVAWLHGNTLIQSLEKGVFPAGQISLAPSRDTAEESVRLRTAHNLKSELLVLLSREKGRPRSAPTRLFTSYSYSYSDPDSYSDPTPTTATTTTTTPTPTTTTTTPITITITTTVFNYYYYYYYHYCFYYYCFYYCYYYYYYYYNSSSSTSLPLYLSISLCLSLSLSTCLPINQPTYLPINHSNPACLSVCLSV